MPSDVTFTDGGITVESGLYDTDDGIKLQVAGEDYPRVHLTPQGEVLVGDGTEAPTALSGNSDLPISRVIGTFVLVDSSFGDPVGQSVALLEGTVAYFFTGHEIGDDPWEFAGLYAGHAPDPMTPAPLTAYAYQPTAGSEFFSRGFIDLSGGDPQEAPYAADDKTPRIGYVSPVNGIDAPVFTLLMEHGQPGITDPSLVTADDQADAIAYDNGTSGLTATDVQAAIDELKAAIDAL